MRAYIIRRLLLAIPTFLLATMIVFLLVRFIPGGVIDIMLAEMASQGSGFVTEQVTREMLQQRLGLDVPIHVQYGRWLGVLPQHETGYSGILQGSLGDSLWQQMPITEELFRKIPVSLELGLLGLVTALIIAIPIGVYSAIRQDTVTDYIGRTIAILCISLPSFWLGTIVIVYPSIWWRWTPPLRYVPFIADPLANLGQFILPALIMGMVMSGTTMRMTRTMLLEVLRQDYIRTAWAKGLTERTVILRHALKNAFIPVVTIVGLQIPILIGGSVVLENIFVLPGIGFYLLQSIQHRDYPAISAINVFLAAGVLIINIVVDLVYAYLDPRIQYR